eukprot:3076187-Rhodomonas_salina.3
MQRRGAAAGLVMGGVAAGLGGMQMMKMQRECAMTVNKMQRESAMTVNRVESLLRYNKIENLIDKIKMLITIIRNQTRWYDFEDRIEYNEYLDWFEKRPDLRRELVKVEGLLLNCLAHEKYLTNAETSIMDMADGWTVWDDQYKQMKIDLQDFEGALCAWLGWKRSSSGEEGIPRRVRSEQEEERVKEDFTLYREGYRNLLTNIRRISCVNRRKAADLDPTSRGAVFVQDVLEMVQRDVDSLERLHHEYYHYIGTKKMPSNELVSRMQHLAKMYMHRVILFKSRLEEAGYNESPEIIGNLPGLSMKEEKKT